MRRRTFLSSSTAATAAMTASAADSGKLKAGDVPRRAFGKTGERLSIIGQAIDPQRFWMNRHKFRYMTCLNSRRAGSPRSEQ